MENVIKSIDQKIKKEFDQNRRILSFDEYLSVLSENPQSHLRGSAQYMLDMFDHFGKTPVAPEDTTTGRNQIYRFGLFDLSHEGVPKIIGQEEVQTQIYRSLKSFVRQGLNNRLLLLHGPNGSAKSSLIHAIMGGLEYYSRQKEGACYTFSWAFPHDRATKGSLGIQSYTDSKEPFETYAHLPDEQVSVRIPNELKDHPILLIPVEHRRDFLDQILGKEKTEEIWSRMPNYLTEGDLSHRAKDIFDALLEANGGNFKKVLMHIQVNRIYYSRRYRRGLVTIEPQLHVDATYSQLAYSKNVTDLPASLQNLSLFTLGGDLVDGNRGVIEFSDLLKRPVDSFKYLLTACETGSVNIGLATAHLDAVMLGSTNELQLDAFKEFPDFSSFKARIELIRVPYLLQVDKEAQIYEPIVQELRADKVVSPHVTWTLALWAVLTRLKKPNSINYPPNVSTLISSLTPLEKARLYNKGDIPGKLSPEDRKLLRAALSKLKEEYINIPYYEGRMGASAREIKSIIFDSVQNPDFPCLSPLAIIKTFEEFVKKVSEYEFLKQDVKDGYHDAAEFINVVRQEYMDIVDREVRSSIGLYDSAQWEDFLTKYVTHISHVIKKEKIRNEITGKQENPDQALIKEFEKIVAAPKDEKGLEGFRQQIISRIGAWSLDHKEKDVVYSKVFPEYWAKLEKHFYESQKSILFKMHNALQVGHASKEKDSTSEGQELARRTVNNMIEKLGYTETGAKEVINFLMKKRY